MSTPESPNNDAHDSEHNPYYRENWVPPKLTDEAREKCQGQEKEE